MNLGPASWSRRERPLAPAAAVGIGPVARALAERLLDPPEGADWRAAGGDGLVLVLGTELPWIEGLAWLGRDPRAPALLMPTLWAPPVHPALIERRLGPVALILEPPRALRLRSVGAVDPDAVRRWLAR